MRAAGRVATGAAVALLTTACGVPTGGPPHSLGTPALPSARSATPGVRPSAAASDPALAAGVVYFVRDTALVGRRYLVPPGSPRMMLQQVLAALTAGPGAGGQALGLGSVIPAGLGLSVSAVDGDRVTIDLSGEVPGPSGDDSVLAVAQVVLSATSLPQVSRVSLTREGSPIEAPLIGGALTSAPLTAADYRPLVDDSSR